MLSLLQDLVIGTFTNSREYLPRLEASIKKFYPDIPYILQFADAPINRNFEDLRQKFIQSGKRYWLFLDHDIQFTSSDTIRLALETMIRKRFALVGVYSTYVLGYQARPEELAEKEVGWMPGYFQLVDSRRVGHIGADLQLPFPNQSIDTSYCVSIQAEGYKIGIAPSYVYHQYKPLNLTYHMVIQQTNDYLMQKWGQFYFDTCQYCGCLIGPDPGAEIWNMSEEELQIRMDNTFNEFLDPKADGQMGELMWVLKSYAEKYDSVTEFGVQKGASSTAFAAGKPKKFTSYELYDVMDSSVKALLGRYAGWKYHSGSNSLTTDIEEVDVLFIDTDHMYEQLLAELRRHSGKVKHCILLHDTINCGLVGERGAGPKGLLHAINEFIAEHDEWFIEKTYMFNHGLTVLRRQV
jgi:hypothetical protein